MKLRDDETGIEIDLTYDSDGFPLVNIDLGGNFYAENQRPAVQVTLDGVEIHDMFADDDDRWANDQDAPLSEKLLDGTKWLFMAESDNEASVQPVTLQSTLESVRGGYSPDPDGQVDMEPVQQEVERLIGVYGGDALVDDFLTDANWQERVVGDLQARARNGPCNGNVCRGCC